MRFKPVHPDFGVEVSDHDLVADNSPEAIAALKAALDEHQMLLFRGGPQISPERHLEIASWFGPPSDALSGEKVSTFHNERTAGSIRLPYHSDLTYTDFPIPILSLHALELPPGGTTTSFVSSATNWDYLDAELQAKLAALTLRHRHKSTYQKDEPEMVAHHPVRFSHPRTGRPILLVTEHHADRIEELSPEESDRMIKDLHARLYAPERVYTHQWRLYDFMIWDNLTLQHARKDEAAMSDGVRLLQRVAVGGRSHRDILEEAKQAERERSERQPG
jgi:taurine dioxygenase